MLLIIDNQSQYLRQFKRHFLDDNEIPHVIYEHNEQIDWKILPDVQGLLLSGGKGNPYEPLNLTTNYAAMMNLDVPTIGFCLGHEIIGAAYQGRIKRLPEYQSRKELIHLTKVDDPIFARLEKSDVMIQKKHRFHLPKAPAGFEVIGHSAICDVEVMRHKEKPIYGFQGHPEVSGSDGIRIMEGFLSLCNLLNE